jgi:signal transduction histidine kinase
VEASRTAGMAEVATSVLHNVGNVLNSVNVSAEVVADKVRQFRIGSLKNVADLLRQHAHNLPEFLSRDPRGQALPDYLLKLAVHLAEPQKAILQEVESLKKNINHIKEVVARQQSHARSSGILERLSAAELVEDAIRINAAAFARHGVRVIREYNEVPSPLTDRHKVLQILVNLLENAKHALETAGNDKKLILRIAPNGATGLRITVIDNGIGIAPESLARIFQHGFTTKKDGHGFGLHSGVLAAQELGGALTVQSDGLGQGATFTLELPFEPPERNITSSGAP